MKLNNMKREYLNDMKREYNKLIKEAQEDVDMLHKKHKKIRGLIDVIENADPDGFDPIPIWFGAQMEIIEEDE